jgi:hypothetical protein
MVPTLFFEASQGVTAQLSELFNFTWPTEAALWNLRWQVLGYVQTTGKVDHHDLNARFVRGSGVASADLKSACLVSTWEAQQEQFAKFLLFELCALYEAWLEFVVPRAVARRDVENVRKLLQFPPDPQKPASGYTRGITIVNSDVSQALRHEIFPVLITHSKNSWSSVAQLLIAYRYFKEVRNVCIHAGGLADQKVIDTHSLLQAIPPTTFGFNRAVPEASPVPGAKVRISLFDMVGFSTIVHRLIVTFDAALAVSKTAEADLVARVRAKHPLVLMLSTSNHARRRQQVVQLLSKARVPKPVSTRLLEGVLIGSGIAA